MTYLIRKSDLKAALLDKLVEEVRGKYFSFFTDSMNRVFIEQTKAFDEDLFFEMIKDAKASAAIYFLEDEDIYEIAFQEVLKEVIEEFKNKKPIKPKLKPFVPPIEEEDSDDLRQLCEETLRLYLSEKEVDHD